MKTLDICDYKGYNIIFIEESGIYTLVMTDKVIAHLVMNATSVVNEHPSVKAVKDFKKMIDLYIELKEEQ